MLESDYRFTVDIPEDVHWGLKSYCAEHRVTMKITILRIVRNFLKEEQNARRKIDPNEDTKSS